MPRGLGAVKKRWARRRHEKIQRIALTLLAEPDRQHYAFDVKRTSRVRAALVFRFLHRWTDMGWLSEGWDDPVGRKVPPRRWYRLTDDGKKALAVLTTDLAP